MLNTVPEMIIDFNDDEHQPITDFTQQLVRIRNHITDDLVLKEV